MKNIVELSEDIDLVKIKDSGQCFRMKELPGAVFRIIQRGCILYIKKLSPCKFSVSVSPEEWKTVWHDYFDLGRSYSDINKKICGINPFVDQAIKYSSGIRILRQDPWETLISFIISQRKNIPAISSAVEAISRTYGKKIILPENIGKQFQSEGDELFAFPSPIELSKASLEDLKKLSLGYRADYIYKTSLSAANKEIDLYQLSELNDEDLIGGLMNFRGVGLKVASCVALFAYGRTRIAPVDVWIDRVIKEEFKEKNLFLDLGDAAGIVQQYCFFYKRSLGK